jgi:hypothetical protein
MYFCVFLLCAFCTICFFRVQKSLSTTTYSCGGPCKRPLHAVCGREIPGAEEGFGKSSSICEECAEAAATHDEEAEDFHEDAEGGTGGEGEQDAEIQDAWEANVRLLSTDVKVASEVSCGRGRSRYFKKQYVSPFNASQKNAKGHIQVEW